MQFQMAPLGLANKGMNMNVKIEKATLIDVPRVTMMAERVHEENKESINDELRATMLKNMMLAIASPDKAVLVATIDKRGKRRIIGMLGIGLQQHPIEGLVAVGDYLYVEPKYRSNGVTRKLMEAGEELAIKAGAKKAYTEAKAYIRPILDKAGYQVENIIMSKVLAKSVETEAVK